MYENVSGIQGFSEEKNVKRVRNMAVKFIGGLLFHEKSFKIIAALITK